jgi:cold-inducible RNA-binding protein
MSMKLYVGNLAFETSSNDLQTLFAQAGTVESVSLIEDRETGRSRGFGFVEMSTKEEGAAAIQQFNGTELGGRALNVNEAKPRENRYGGGVNGISLPRMYVNCRLVSVENASCPLHPPTKCPVHKGWLGPLGVRVVPSDRDQRHLVFH